MNFFKQLARGAERGVPAYLAGQRAKQEREDRLARIVAEQDRYLRQENALRRDREEQRNYRKLQLQVGSLNDNISAHDKLINDAVSAGRPPETMQSLIDARNRLNRQRDELINGYQPAQEVRPTPQVGARLMGQPNRQDSVLTLPEKPKMQIGDTGEVPEVGYIEESEIPPAPGDLDASGMIPYINSMRQSTIMDEARKLNSTAQKNLEAATIQLRNKFPDIEEDEIAQVVAGWQGLEGAGEWGQYDSNSGLQWNKKEKIWKAPPGMPQMEMTKEQFSRASSLYDDWRIGNPVKMFGAAQAGFEGAESGYIADDAPGDVALLYGFAKAVAPDDSAVREGEFSTMEDIMPVVQKYLNWMPKVTNARRLNTESRRRIWSQLYGIYRARKKTYLEHSEEIARRAQSAGLKSEWVIPKLEKMQGGAWRLDTRTLIGQAAQGNTEAEEELRLRFGVQEGESLVEILKKQNYRNPK